jgi:hypothetical protein
MNNMDSDQTPKEHKKQSKGKKASQKNSREYLFLKVMSLGLRFFLHSWVHFSKVKLSDVTDSP